jgi:hypothetical protein
VAISLRLPHCLPPPQRLCHHGANNDSVSTTTNPLQQKRPEAATATAVVGNFEIPSQSSKSQTTNSSALVTKPLPLSFFTPAPLFSQVHDDIQLHVTHSVRNESTPAAYFPSACIT